MERVKLSVAAAVRNQKTLQLHKSHKRLQLLTDGVPLMALRLLSVWCTYTISVLLQSHVTHAQYTLRGFDFHIEDMFDEQLMPMRILSQHEVTKWLAPNGTSPNEGVGEGEGEGEGVGVGVGGGVGAGVTAETCGFDVNAALDSMDYHRRMMNEFMASDYITQQILHETLMQTTPPSPPPPPPADSFPTAGGGGGGDDGVNGVGVGAAAAAAAGISKRMGAVKGDDDVASTMRQANNTSSSNKNHTSSGSSSSSNHHMHHSTNANHKLLSDEGMTRYKTWLRRYALLNKMPTPQTPTNAHNGQRSSGSTLKDIQKQLHAQTPRHAGAGVDGVVAGERGSAHGAAAKHKRRQQQLPLQPKRANAKMDAAASYGDYDGDVETAHAQEQDDDFEDGDITGYALASNPYDYVNSQPNWAATAGSGAGMATQQQSLLPAGILALSPLAKNAPAAGAVNEKNGYDGSYDDYSGGAPAVYHAPPAYSHHHAPAPPPPPPPPPPPALHPPPDEHMAPAAASGKEIGLKDITDIALTTLAFLSFGMFMLQVLMCITMGKEEASSSMMMLPMEATDTTDTMNDGVEEIRRRKRRAAHNDNQRLTMMNELARRVLFSLDAALRVGADDGACNYWSLCENNRYARRQSNGQKFWIPVWSLGLSWLTSRVRRDGALHAQGDYYTIMQSLKAIVIGMASDNCERFYANACASDTKPAAAAAATAAASATTSRSKSTAMRNASSDGSDGSDTGTENGNG